MMKALLTKADFAALVAKVIQAETLVTQMQDLLSNADRSTPGLEAAHKEARRLTTRLKAQLSDLGGIAGTLE